MSEGTGGGPVPTYQPPTHNRARILHALRREPGLSKTGIAGRLGLSSGTVSVLAGELMDAGLVVSGDYHPSTGGRPAQQLSLNPRRPLMLGIDLGETDAQMGVLNLQGRLLATEHHPLSRRRGSVRLAPLLDAAADLAARHPGICGAGVAVPGRLDRDLGTVLRAANLGWRNVPLLATATERLGMATTIDRNTNAALLAEEWWGSAPAGDPFVFLTAGSGVGAAIKVRGQLLRGATNEAGELGHIPADPVSGPVCRCGLRGCLETVGSARAAVERYQELHRAAGTRDRATRARTTVAELMAVRTTDPHAVRALEQVAEQLGHGIATLVSLINPGVIVLGGELMDAEPIVLPRLRQVVRQSANPGTRAAVQVTGSSFGYQASLVGAATLGFEQLFADPNLAGARADLQRA